MTLPVHQPLFCNSINNRILIPLHFRAKGIGQKQKHGSGEGVRKIRKKPAPLNETGFIILTNNSIYGLETEMAVPLLSPSGSPFAAAS